MRNALGRFEELGGSEFDKHQTLNRIVYACFHAAHYDPASDPGLRYRKAMSQARKEVLKLARAAHLLAKAAERNAPGLELAIAMAGLDAGVVLKPKGEIGAVPVREVAALFFEALEGALRGKLPEIHGGPFLHRFTIGNLCFVKPLGPGRKIETSTMLGFELAVYLRLHTAGLAQDRSQTAQEITAGGRPCLPVVAAFCTAALGAHVDTVRLGDRLRKLGSSVRLADWPQPE